MSFGPPRTSTQNRDARSGAGVRPKTKQASHVSGSASSTDKTKPYTRSTAGSRSSNTGQSRSSYTGLTNKGYSLLPSRPTVSGMGGCVSKQGEREESYKRESRKRDSRQSLLREDRPASRTDNGAYGRTSSSGQRTADYRSSSASRHVSTTHSRDYSSLPVTDSSRRGVPTPAVEPMDIAISAASSRVDSSYDYQLERQSRDSPSFNQQNSYLRREDVTSSRGPQSLGSQYQTSPEYASHSRQRRSPSPSPRQSKSCGTGRSSSYDVVTTQPGRSSPDTRSPPRTDLLNYSGGASRQYDDPITRRDVGSPLSMPYTSSYVTGAYSGSKQSPDRSPASMDPTLMLDMAPGQNRPRAKERKLKHATDKLSVSRHVWEYIQAFHKQAIKQVMDNCSLSSSIAVDSNNIDIEFDALTQDKLNIAVNELFIPLFQSVSNQITFDEYDMNNIRDKDDIVRTLQSRYRCVVSKKDRDHIQVICKISDKTSIKNDLAQQIAPTQSAARSSYASGSPSAYPKGSSSKLPANKVAAYSIRETNIFIQECDITQLVVDAVVSTTNPELMNHAGLARVIATAAGYSLVQECNRIITKKGALHVSEVVRTGAGNMKTKHILHACGPMWSQYDTRLQKECIRDLHKTFANIFELASRYKVTSIAIPPVSSGVLGVPLNYVAESLHQEIIRQIRDQTSGLREIYLVDINPDFLVLLNKLFERNVLEGSGVRVLTSSAQRSSKVLDEPVPLRSSIMDDNTAADKNRKSLGAVVDDDFTMEDARRPQVAVVNPTPHLVDISRKSLGAVVPDDNDDEMSLNTNSFPSSTSQVRQVERRRDRYSRELADLNSTMGFQPKGFKVNNAIEVVIHKCDITKLHVDAIVNAANTTLDPSGGLSKIIATAAGYKLVKECQEKVKRGPLSITDVVKTKGGNLPSKYVLHAVGPHWPKHNDSQRQHRCIEDLEMTFCNIFNMAQKEGITSIACPAISAGVYRVPLEYVANAACEAVLNTVQTSSSLREVHLVDIADVTLEALKRAFENGLQTGCISTLDTQRAEQLIECRVKGTRLPTQTAEKDQKITRKSAMEVEPSPKGPAMIMDKFTPVGFRIYNTNVYLHICDMTKMKVDAIVNAANSILNNAGGLAKTISHAAGPELENECKKIINKYYKLRDGDVVKTSGGKLPARYVLHAVGPIWPKDKDRKKQEKCLQDLRITFNKVMDQARRYAFRSIAIPSISSGIFGVPEKEVAIAMSEQVMNGLSISKDLRDVHLVDISPNILQLVKDKLSASPSAKLLREDDVAFAINAAIINHGVSNHFSETRDVPLPSSRSGSLEKPKNTSVPSRTSPSASSRTSPSASSRASPSASSRASPSASSPQTSAVTGQMSKMSVQPRPNSTHKSYGEVVDSDEESNTPRKVLDVRPKERPKDKGKRASKQKSKDEICVICLNDIVKPKTLSKCKHTFCEQCIDLMFKKYQPKCPSCGIMYGMEKGTQPNGTMTWKKLPTSLPGYEHSGSFLITYNFASGIQLEDHPNPGQHYQGTSRSAYLPDTQDGRDILKLLKKAFDAKLVFTIGRSVTTGAENVVTWNDIHHKTATHGGPTAYGYPDPTYLNRVREELAAKGVM